MPRMLLAVMGSGAQECTLLSALLQAGKGVQWRSALALVTLAAPLWKAGGSRGCVRGVCWEQNEGLSVGPGARDNMDEQTVRWDTSPRMLCSPHPHAELLRPLPGASG